MTPKPLTKELLETVEGYRDEMVGSLSDMLRIPAVGPESGGQGESEKAKLVIEMARKSGFADITVHNAPDKRVDSGVRPNIMARRQGASGRTLWLIAHIDVVPPGDVNAWTSPPYSPRVVDGKLYGRGSEDNGQAVIASLYAAKAVLDLSEELNIGIGLALVADEEAGSEKGVAFLIQQGLFQKDDIIYVPDFGLEDGSAVEVAEKSLIWLKFVVEGKQVHASTPERGLNAMRIASELMLLIDRELHEKYPDRDELFMPSCSTFEPTKRLLNVENINTVPGEDTFFFDIRLLPKYDPDELVEFVLGICKKHEAATGAKIIAEVDTMGKAGKPSRTDSEAYLTLARSIERIRGIVPHAVGIGGGTCAKEFRQEGMDAYVWETCDEMAHQVDEYAKIDNLVNDAKVFAMVIAELCCPGQFNDR